MANIYGENGGGGWMSDYDTFPLGLSAEEGLEIAKQPGFKSYSLHVPNIIHATHKAWENVLQKIIESLPEERGKGVGLVTDMFMLIKVKDKYTKEELMITEWKRESSSFVYKRPKNATEDLLVNCKAAKAAKVAHISHADCEEAYEKYHSYPRLDGLNSGNYLNRRGEAALVFMKHFADQCSE